MTAARSRARLRSSTCSLALGLFAAALAIAAAPAPAAAQPEPTPEQMEQAKAAFKDGKAAFDKGDYAVAVEKFKESYRLSRNPLLLFNIALTFERLGTNDMALFYYKKFLADAPADAAQRPDAEKSIAALEKAPVPDANDPFATGGDGGGDTGGGDTPPPKPDPKPKRTAAYTIDDFQHQLVEDAPPGKPLDLTAFVPEDSGWTVTLYVRGAGEDKFTVVPMRPRYNELVGRVPASKMTGNAIQYYLELRDAGGEVIHRVGKSTSPNVVYIDEAARPRYYPDLDDTAGDGGGDRGGDRPIRGDEEDPLGGSRTRITPSGPGLTDVGSSKFEYAKWGSTGTALGMLTLSLTGYLIASNAASQMEGEAALSNDEDECPNRPCFAYDDYYKDLQAHGERWETISKVTLVLGVAATGVATYFWYKEIRARKRAERGPSGAARAPRGLDSLVAAPVAGDDFIGGAAALRF